MLQKLQLLYISYLFYFRGAIASSVTGLLLTFCLGITPGFAQGSMWGARNQTRVGCMQDNFSSHGTITLALLHF